jgi:hypothetical protein
MRGPDVLALLADQDPVCPHELPGPESAFGERLKQRILLTEAIAPAPSPRRRRRWTVVAGAGAAALGLAAVALPHAFRGHGLGASPAAAALNRAAEAAVSASPTTPAGRYAYSRARTLWSATSTDEPPYTVLISRTVETWLAADGSGLVREGPGKPVFPGPRDHARWLAAGAPALAGHGGDQRYRPHEPDLPALARRDPDDLDAAQLDALMNAPAALPTDPDRLERLVRAYAKTKDPPLASMMFNQLTELAGESWGSAGLRAAAYRVLARIDGVELAGEVRDPLGRRGVALVAPVGYTDEIRSRLIIDPQSGDVLATQTLLARRGDWIDAAPGDVVGQVVYVDSGRVDEVGRRPSQ